MKPFRVLAVVGLFLVAFVGAAIEAADPVCTGRCDMQVNTRGNYGGHGSKKDHKLKTASKQLTWEFHHMNPVKDVTVRVYGFTYNSTSLCPGKFKVDGTDVGCDFAMTFSGVTTKVVTLVADPSYKGDVFKFNI